VAYCDHGNESLGFIKGRKFTEQLSNYQVLKKDSDSWSQSLFTTKQEEKMIVNMKLGTTGVEIILTYFKVLPQHLHGD
jgi:hypothetical protein